LLASAENAHAGCIQLLLNAGANASFKDKKSGRTPLILSTLAGSTEAVVPFLEPPNASQYVDLQDDSGYTALHWGVKLEHEDVVSLLVEKGNASLEIKDSEGRTALHYAVTAGNEDSVKYLLSKNADPTVRDKYHNTPLHFAAFKGNLEIIQLLLSSSYPIDIDAKNNKGETPLHWAAKNSDNLRVVKLLIEKAAKLDSLNNEQETPFMIAADINPDSEVASYISKITGEVFTEKEEAEEEKPEPKETKAANVVQRKAASEVKRTQPPFKRGDRKKPQNKRNMVVWRVVPIALLVVILVLLFLYFN